MQSRDSKDAKRGKGKPRATHHVDEESLSVVYSISDKRGVTVEMDVAGRQIELEIDTGATVTVIPLVNIRSTSNIYSCAQLPQDCTSTMDSS